MPTPAKKSPAAKKATGKKTPAQKDAALLADWTLLIYMAGDNNLDSFGGEDLMEMKKVGSSEKLHIIVQRDTVEAGQQPCRYRIQKGTKLAADVLQNLGPINTGDPKVLQDFLNWGLTTYPAKRIMAVLWNHGNGWDDTDIYEAARRRGLKPVAPAASVRRSAPRRDGAPPVGEFVRRSVTHKRTRSPFFLTAWKTTTVGGLRRAIAFDDTAQDFLDNVEMKKVFAAITRKQGRPFDAIGMDACMMAMVETGSQIQGSGLYFCGSQEIEPGNGWPYDVILKDLAAKTSMDGKALCALIAKHFVASYKKTEPVTQSACDLGEPMTGVVKAANALGALLAKAWSAPVDVAAKRAIAFVRDECQGYDHPDYVDLWDFTTRLTAAHPPYAKAAAAVQTALSACVFANHAPNKKVSGSHGLSIYLPTGGKLSPLYKTLDFGTGGWAAFLNVRAKK